MGGSTVYPLLHNSTVTKIDRMIKRVCLFVLSVCLNQLCLDRLHMRSEVYGNVYVCVCVCVSIPAVTALYSCDAGASNSFYRLLGTFSCFVLEL